jgi:hypothetical protein
MKANGNVGARFEVCSAVASSLNASVDPAKLLVAARAIPDQVLADLAVQRAIGSL